MQKLFTYGTLQRKDIQETVFGRVLKGSPETLVGYVINQINIEEEFGMEQYPIIKPTQNQSDTINGILYELSAKELQQADIYEGLHYKRIEVQLQSNQTAWVYSATL